MKKCSLCRLTLEDNEVKLLPYSKGDYFCSYCYPKIEGSRRCIVCNDEFYYTRNSPNKPTCGGLRCTNMFHGVRSKIENNKPLTPLNEKRAKEWGLTK